MKKPHFDIVAILGPTAAGKTRLAVSVAQHLGCEIISADSRQVYRRMDIGTGKDLGEYTLEGGRIRHHLIDIVEPGTEFNVFEYQRCFLDAYEDMQLRGKLPLLCGGSGMYLDAVLSGYRLLEAPPNENLRAELDRLSQSELVSRLHGLRDLHNTTDTSDRARLVRAIEIAEHMQNTPDSELRLDLVARVYGLRWDRDRLRRRIVERLNHRLECGLIEEVQGLLGEGLTSQQLEFYGLEYRFVTRYVFGELTRNDMVQKLTSSITQFAKKQETWFRRMERRGLAIRWLDGARPGEELLDEIAADVADPKVSQ